MARHGFMEQYQWQPSQGPGSNFLSGYPNNNSGSGSGYGFDSLNSFGQQPGSGLVQQPGNPFFNFFKQNGEGISQALGGFSALANLYGGFKQLGLEKDKFKFSKQAWQKDYEAQIKDYENNLRDRWAARDSSAAARGQSYRSLDGYLAERKIGG